MPVRGCGALWLRSLSICRLLWCWRRWRSLTCCCWWWGCGGVRRRLLVRGLMQKAKNIPPQGTRGYTGENLFPPRRTRGNTEGVSRRAFVAGAVVLPWAFRGIASAASKTIPVGLELYSVREALKADAEGTVRAVAQM